MGEASKRQVQASWLQVTGILNPTTVNRREGHDTDSPSRRVTFSPSEFRFLDLLVEYQGTVLSHQFLEDALWGDMMCSFGLVKKYIQQVRRKLRDDARAPRWITCVRGVGYRFIGSSPKAPYT